MYIRRKVFSVALDEYGEERYFSTNEIINEDDYLDEVLYSDVEERMFTEFKVGGERIAVNNAVLSQAADAHGMTAAEYTRYLRNNPAELEKFAQGRVRSRTMVEKLRGYRSSASNATDPTVRARELREFQEIENRGLDKEFRKMQNKRRNKPEFKGEAGKGSAFFGKDAAAILDANEAKPVRRIGQQAGAKKSIKNLMTTRNAKIAGGVGAGALAAGGLYYGAKKYKESHSK